VARRGGEGRARDQGASGAKSSPREEENARRKSRAKKAAVKKPVAKEEARGQEKAGAKAAKKKDKSDADRFREGVRRWCTEKILGRVCTIKETTFQAAPHATKTRFGGD